MLIGDILRASAAAAPHRTAILFGEQSLTYGELDAQSNRFANGLLALGLGGGRKIGIFSRNNPDYVVAFFGAAKAGAVSVHLSPRLAAEELARAAEGTDIEALFTTPALAPLVRESRAHMPTLRHLLVSGEGMVEFLAGQPATPPAVQLDPSDPLSINFTGGTTGSPKGAVSSHRARVCTAEAAAKGIGFESDDIVGVVTPLFHVVGLFVCFLGAMRAGATALLLEDWNPRSFTRAVAERGVSAALFVPTQLGDLINDPDFDPAALSGLAKAIHGGAPMSEKLHEQLTAALPHTELIADYGQTEFGTMTMRRGKYLPDKKTSVGLPHDCFDLRLVDAKGVPVEVGEVGEIIGRGPVLFSGYYKDPERTRAAFKMGDEWLWTGDQATRDEDGFIYIVGRGDDMINAGGENIYPAEIEEALIGHRAVRECAAFAIPDDRFGQLPAAHVVLEEGHSVQPDELIDFCAGRIAKFKRPRHIKIVDALARTSAGKIQRALIRAPYWDGA